MNSETCRAVVRVNRLEPGRHIFRKTVQRDVIPARYFDIPCDECKEVRPDWGEYFPLQTLPALERALRARGAFSAVIGPDCEFSYGYVT